MKQIKNILLLTFILAVSSESILNKIESDKLYISIGEKSFPINLIENSVTMELISILPMKVKLLNEDISSKNLSLNIYIEISKDIANINSEINSKKGDLILFHGRELILFNEEKIIKNDKGDYLKIGYTEDADNLYNSITKNKRIILLNSLNYETNIGKVKPYAYYTSLMNYLSWKMLSFFCFLFL